jgi:hypothetical protein
MTSSSLETINIRPGVSILSVLKHLNYKPWYALAEFVDNSLQSYLDHQDELKNLHGDDFKLLVTINIDLSDSGKIIIKDNAAGISQFDYERAFRPAAIPTDRSGLSEFGMGMKSAACWFAKYFLVRTSSFGEPIEREIYFNVEEIIKNSTEELNIKSITTMASAHFTEIVLTGIHKPIQTKTISKIKDHLTSIYREFFRTGILEIKFNNEILRYIEPKVLQAPYYKNVDGPLINWNKDIDFDFGNGLKVSGFAALRETGSTSNAGFALFRRSRVIQGSLDDGYRPEQIFKKSNSYTYQRLFGELHLEGFDVSHTKDGFRWEDNEETFLDLLEDHLSQDPLNLLDQAEGHRARPKTEDLQEAAETATDQTARAIKAQAPEIIKSQLESPLDNADISIGLPSLKKYSRYIINTEINNVPWEIVLETSIDSKFGDWIEISSQPSQSDQGRKVGIRMSLVHPFMQRFAGSDPDKIEGLLRVATAIVLAEVTARESGVKQAGTIRRNINQLLIDALSSP